MPIDNHPLEVQAAFILTALIQVAEAEEAGKAPDATPAQQFAAAMSNIIGPGVMAAAQEVNKKMKDDPRLSQIFATIKEEAAARLGLPTEPVETAAVVH